MGEMSENQYIYAVARIRAKELELLDGHFIERLAATGSYEDALRLIRERGWGSTGDESLEGMLSAEREKTWRLMRELVDDMSIFDTLLCENDFHNLKAVIKQAYLGRELTDIFTGNGTVDLQAIRKAVSERDFSLLPEHMSLCAKESYEVLFHTGNSQLSDAIADRACLDAIYAKGMASANEALMDYAELKVALSDMLIAARCQETGRDGEFLERALAVCKTLDIKRLIEAALAGKDALCSYIETTSYKGAAGALKVSLTSFEAWSDSLIINHMKRQKYNPFTAAPIIAYALARENEIKTVGIVLHGKLHNLPDEDIKERTRATYV